MSNTRKQRSRRRVNDVGHTSPQGPTPTTKFSREDALTRILARLLRHHPEEFDVVVDSGGWAAIGAVVEAINEKSNFTDLQNPLVMNDLKQLARLHGSERFEVDSRRIRARYGHSLAHVVSGVPRVPPMTLLHGTSRNLTLSILRRGLHPGTRTFVHLTTDYAYAIAVAQTTDKPTVLAIRARQAAFGGIQFRQATSQIWLSPPIPADFVVFPFDNDSWPSNADVAESRQSNSTLTELFSFLDVYCRSLRADEGPITPRDSERDCYE